MTPETKNRIAKLTSAGMSQRDIADALHRPRGFIYRAQRALGLTADRHGPRAPKLTRDVEEKILALLRDGRTPKQIIATLKVRPYALRTLAESSGIRRRPGYWCKKRWRDRVAPELRQKIVAEIQSRANSGKDLASKYDAPPSEIYALAHEVLGAARFVPGPTQRVGPFRSHFPLREHRQNA